MTGGHAAQLGQLPGWVWHGRLGAKAVTLVTKDGEPRVYRAIPKRKHDAEVFPRRRTRARARGVEAVADS